MHQRILIVLVIILENLICSAQNEIPVPNALYVEFGGNAGYASLNYERLALSKKKMQLGIRVGLSTLKIRDYRNKFNPDIIIPLAFNLTYGNKHKTETGVGTTYINSASVGESLSPVRTSTLHGNLNIGYRYQKATGGLLFRICYTPIFEYFSSIRHWAGVSFGYAF